MSTSITITKSIKNESFFHLDADQSAQAFLDDKAVRFQSPLNSEQFALMMDKQDPLAPCRREFFYPKKMTLPNGEYDERSKLYPHHLYAYL